MVHPVDFHNQEIIGENVPDTRQKRLRHAQL
mgnify:CR=1 FL=1